MAGLESGNSDNNYRSVGNDCESGFSTPENRNTEFQTENNDNCTTATPSLLSSPRMVHNPFAVKVDTPTRSMADSTDHKEFRPILAPATLVLGRCGGETEKKLDSSEVSTTSDNAESMYPDTGQESETNTSVAVRAAEGALRKTSLVVPSRPITQQIEETERQVDENMPPINQEKLPSNIPSSVSPPKRSTFSSNASTSSAGQSGAFIFGQNMNERVVNAIARQRLANGTAGLFSKLTDCVVEEDEEGLFRNAKVPTVFSESPNDSSFDSATVERQIKSLTESAQEYEARQVKRTYEEVTIVTGEEDESNVLQMNCKLFAFDKVNASWIEKGRCLLRLNDKETEDNTIHSRLVARTSGSLRVVLNTKVWAGMSVDRPSTTSVRLTVMEGETVRVFLVSGSAKDIDQLFGALDWRITTLKSSEDRRNAEGCSSMSVGSSTCGGLGDETISSSATSPVSPLVEMASTSAAPDNYQNVSTSAVSGLETVVGTKKRRISPPSEDSVSFGSHNEDQLNNSQVQERIVDSTDNNDSNSADSKLN
ncbi:hypothetical protein CHUAL_014042 [Chamberlinius hualienensis]